MKECFAWKTIFCGVEFKIKEDHQYYDGFSPGGFGLAYEQYLLDSQDSRFGRFSVHADKFGAKLLSGFVPLSSTNVHEVSLCQKSFTDLNLSPLSCGATIRQRGEQLGLLPCSPEDGAQLLIQHGRLKEDYLLLLAMPPVVMNGMHFVVSLQGGTLSGSRGFPYVHCHPDNIRLLFRLP